MTNFEKWKAELTPELFALYFAQKDCLYCKAHIGCDFLKGSFSCHQRIIAWANAEAEEDGNE